VTALLMDVGNSRIKWGIDHDGAIRRTGQITQKRLREDGLAALTSRLPHEVDSVLVSNVAGRAFATRLSGVVGLHCDTDVHFVRSERKTCGVVNGYRQPRRLGVDRWVAMIGAWAEFADALLVVDAGTAVTIDAIDTDGRHLGGQIMPGVHLMATSLATETSDIPEVRRALTSQPCDLEMFAASTAAAVASGTLNSIIGAIERAAKAMRDNGQAPVVVLTGGDASRILKSLDCEAEHRPHLVLHGLARILEDRQ
jgi:type III pantothenate kinase